MENVWIHAHVTVLYAHCSFSHTGVPLGFFSSSWSTYLKIPWELALVLNSLHFCSSWNDFILPLSLRNRCAQYTILGWHCFLSTLWIYYFNDLVIYCCITNYAKKLWLNSRNVPQFCGSGIGGATWLVCSASGPIVRLQSDVGWGCRLLSTRTSPQAFRIYNPTGPDGPANAVYVVALQVKHHHVLSVLLVTQGNSGQCGVGWHKGMHCKRWGLLKALLETTTVTSVAV